jgi:hypothetical protein
MSWLLNLALLANSKYQIGFAWLHIVYLPQAGITEQEQERQHPELEQQEQVHQQEETLETPEYLMCTITTFMNSFWP